jgi:hypothetical protein
MKTVVLNDVQVGEFVADRAKCEYVPGAHTTIGVVDDSQPIGSPSRVHGGVIFCSYTGASIWIHVGARNEKWIIPDMLWCTFHYPFVQLGCSRLYGVVESDNEQALNFDLKLGFKVQAVLPGLFVSGAGVVVCMERDECRWLRIKPRNLKGG